MIEPAKIALAVDSDLETWQKLNVAAFLPSGFGTTLATLVGEPYCDGDGRSYPSDPKQVDKAFGKLRLHG